MDMFCPRCKKITSHLEFDEFQEDYKEVPFTSFECKKCKIYSCGIGEWYEAGTRYKDIEFQDVKPLFTNSEVEEERTDELEKLLINNQN